MDDWNSNLAGMGYWNESNEEGLALIRQFVETLKPKQEEKEKEEKKKQEDHKKIVNSVDIYKDIDRDISDFIVDNAQDGVIISDNGFILSVIGAYEDFDCTYPELIYKQGNGYDNFKGTCGLCSTANNARLLHISSPTEKEVIDLAVENDCCFIDESDLEGYSNGGTTQNDRILLGELLDMHPVGYSKIDLDMFEKGLRQGCAITFTVYGEYLRSEVPERLTKKVSANHCITLLEMEYDDDEELVGIYVLDTGGWIDVPSGVGFISASKIRNMIKATEYGYAIFNYKK